MGGHMARSVCGCGDTRACVFSRNLLIPPGTSTAAEAVASSSTRPPLKRRATPGWVPSAPGPRASPSQSSAPVQGGARAG